MGYACAVQASWKRPSGWTTGCGFGGAASPDGRARTQLAAAFTGAGTFAGILGAGGARAFRCHVEETRFGWHSNRGSPDATLRCSHPGCRGDESAAPNAADPIQAECGRCVDCTDPDGGEEPAGAADDRRSGAPDTSVVSSQDWRARHSSARFGSGPVEETRRRGEREDLAQMRKRVQIETCDSISNRGVERRR